MRSILVGSLFVILAVSAGADFVPGRIYISAEHHMPSGPPRIYEFDPATGQGGVFVQMSSGSPSNLLTSISFSPDYSHLRSVNYVGNSLLDFAGDGTYSTAWGPGAGLMLPGRGTYSPAGDYWVAQHGNNQPAILRFPGGQGPPEVFAQFPNAPILTSFGEAIAVDRKGAVYCDKDVVGGTSLMRFSPDGQGEILTTLPGDLASIAIHDVDDVLAWTTMGLFRINPESPDNHVLVTNDLLPASEGTLILLPEENALLAVGVFLIQRVDLGTGVVTDIGNNPAVSPYFTISAAMYVPEPGTLLLLIVCVAASMRRRALG